MFKVHDEVLSESSPYDMKPGSENMVIQCLVNNIIRKMVYRKS